MRRIISLMAILCFGLGVTLPALAQQSDAMSEGILAFRQERYTEAVAAFERALQEDPGNAEAYFLLARLYFETPLRDVGKAGKMLDEALKIDPDNVQYLVARLEQLRVDSWSFISDRIKERRRRELAVKILQLDSTNAFAHEELGKAYIRDFWRYRNAFMYPMVKFRQYDYRQRTEVDPMAGFLARQVEEFDRQFGGEIDVIDVGAEIGTVEQALDPNSIFLADQFDVETLKKQGLPVQDLTSRAQKAYARAIGHLHRALEADPRKRDVYDDLMKIFSLKGEWEEALNMLQNMYVYFPDDSDLWTYLGLAHYRSGNMAAAAKAFETAFKFMTPEEKDAFTRLDEILPEAEKARYEQDKTGYAARFWTSKDPRYLTPYNERKLEHYARLVYADLLYGSPALNKRGWDTERGHILVRYGVPNADVVIIPQSTSGVRRGLPPSSGSVADPNATTSTTLQVGRFGSDFDLLEEANTYNIWDYGDFKFVFEDPFRNGEFRLFSPSAKDLTNGAIPWVNDYEIQAKETFRNVPERYEFEPPGRSVEIPYLVTAFKGSDRQTDLYVNFGIPLAQFDPSQDVINITANTGTFLINEDRDILVERRRTIYGLKTEQVVSFEDTQLWVDTQEMSAPPGHHEVSVEFETASGHTVGVQRREVDVPRFDTDELAVSDIMLAYHVEEVPDGKPLKPSDIVRDGLSIMPAPWTVFSHKQPIYLYFEVYNLTHGENDLTNYEIEAVLAPKDQSKGVSKLVKGIFGGGKKGVSVRLPGSGSASDEGNYLILDASNQKTGLYTLFLKVKDNVSGKEVERQEDLFLE